MNRSALHGRYHWDTWASSSIIVTQFLRCALWESYTLRSKNGRHDARPFFMYFHETKCVFPKDPSQHKLRWWLAPCSAIGHYLNRWWPGSKMTHVSQMLCTNRTYGYEVILPLNEIDVICQQMIQEQFLEWKCCSSHNLWWISFHEMRPMMGQH